MTTTTGDAKHTRGPLDVIPNPCADSAGDPKYLTRTPDGYPVGLAWQRADAVLFAASPDLLAALAALLDVAETLEAIVENDRGDLSEAERAVFARARDAIANATADR